MLNTELADVYSSNDYNASNVDGSGDSVKEKQIINEKTKKRTKRLFKLNSVDKVNNNTHVSGPRLLKLLSKNSRRSRNRFGRGLPKKGGGGGKGTWGKPGCELQIEDEFDEYDDFIMEELNLSETEEQLKDKMNVIIQEYFQTGDTEETYQSLKELHLGRKLSVVPMICIEIALDHKPSHCELTSVLLSDLCGSLYKPKHLMQGKINPALEIFIHILLAFDNLINELPDLILDVPTAPTLLGNFIARAVADDCIPPSYIESYKGCVDKKEVQACILYANQMLSQKHALVRLDNIWGVGGGVRPVNYLVRQINLLLMEYLLGDDTNEAMQCLTELEVPHFHHELVYEAALMAIEHRKLSDEKKLCLLLHHLYDKGVLTQDQLDTGMLRIFEDLNDIELDVPDARTTLDRFVKQLQEWKLLSSDFLIQLLERSRKHSESEEGK